MMSCPPLKRLETRVLNLQKRINDLEKGQEEIQSLGVVSVPRISEPLKPCPFCTCTSPQVESTGLVKVPYAVRCSWCGSKGPSEETEDQSVKSWNRCSR